MEIWKEVPGYPGYEASSLWRIRCRIDCNRYHGVRIRKPTLNICWYNQVFIRKKNVRIHRMVASAFIDNPDNKPCVNHINWVKTDNRVDNLEWCTYKENSKHAEETGLTRHVSSEKQRISAAKVWRESAKPVVWIHKNWYELRFKSVKEARTLTWILHISEACNWKLKTAWGYVWKFEPLPKPPVT